MFSENPLNYVRKKKVKIKIKQDIYNYTVGMNKIYTSVYVNLVPCNSCLRI